MAQSTHPAELARAAYELGWDLAHHAVEPRPQWVSQLPDIAQGLADAKRHFGRRIKQSTPFDRKCLRIRASAMIRGRVCHESVTPQWLELISPHFCPVLRLPMVYESDDAFMYPDRQQQQDMAWSVDRLDNRCGYIAENLVVMSTKANKAKGNLAFDEIRQIAIRASREPGEMLEGLTAAQWGRLAYISSIVVPNIRWRELAALPMLATPPCGVYMSTTVPALQRELSGLPWAKGGITEATSRFQAQFHGKRIKKLAGEVARAHYCAVIRIYKEHQQLIAKGDSSVQAQLHPRTNEMLPVWFHVTEDAWTDPLFMGLWRKLMDQMSWDVLMHIKLAGCRMTEYSAVQAWAQHAGMARDGYLPPGNANATHPGPRPGAKGRATTDASCSPSAIAFEDSAIAS